MPLKQIARLAKCTGACTIACGSLLQMCEHGHTPRAVSLRELADDMLIMCHRFMGSPADACKSLAEMPAAMTAMQAKAVAVCGSEAVRDELPEELTPAQCATRLQAVACRLTVTPEGQMKYTFAQTAALVKRVLGLP